MLIVHRLVKDSHGALTDGGGNVVPHRDVFAVPQNALFVRFPRPGRRTSHSAIGFSGLATVDDASTAVGGVRNFL
jgi:hypothetical protein